MCGSIMHGKKKRNWIKKTYTCVKVLIALGKSFNFSLTQPAQERQRKGEAESGTFINNNASAEYELHVLRHSKAPCIFQETSKI